MSRQNLKRSKWFKIMALLVIQSFVFTGSVSAYSTSGKVRVERDLRAAPFDKHPENSDGFIEGLGKKGAIITVILADRKTKRTYNLGELERVPGTDERLRLRDDPSVEFVQDEDGAWHSTGGGKNRKDEIRARIAELNNELISLRNQSEIVWSELMGKDGPPVIDVSSGEMGDLEAKIARCIREKANLEAEAAGKDEYGGAVVAKDDSIGGGRSRKAKIWAEIAELDDEIIRLLNSHYQLSDMIPNITEAADVNEINSMRLERDRLIGEQKEIDGKIEKLKGQRKALLAEAEGRIAELDDEIIRLLNSHSQLSDIIPNITEAADVNEINSMRLERDKLIGEQKEIDVKIRKLKGQRKALLAGAKGKIVVNGKSEESIGGGKNRKDEIRARIAELNNEIISLRNQSEIVWSELMGKDGPPVIDVSSGEMGDLEAKIARCIREKANLKAEAAGKDEYGGAVVAKDDSIKKEDLQNDVPGPGVPGDAGKMAKEEIKELRGRKAAYGFLKLTRDQFGAEQIARIKRRIESLEMEEIKVKKSQRLIYHSKQEWDIFREALRETTDTELEMAYQKGVLEEIKEMESNEKGYYSETIVEAAAEVKEERTRKLATLYEKAAGEIYPKLKQGLSVELKKALDDLKNQQAVIIDWETVKNDPGLVLFIAAVNRQLKKDKGLKLVLAIPNTDREAVDEFFEAVKEATFGAVDLKGQFDLMVCSKDKPAKVIKEVKAKFQGLKRVAVLGTSDWAPAYKNIRVKGLRRCIAVVCRKGKGNYLSRGTEALEAAMFLLNEEILTEEEAKRYALNEKGVCDIQSENVGRVKIVMDYCKKLSKFN